MTLGPAHALQHLEALITGVDVVGVELGRRRLGWAASRPHSWVCGRSGTSCFCSVGVVQRRSAASRASSGDCRSGPLERQLYGRKRCLGLACSVSYMPLARSAAVSGAEHLCPCYAWVLLRCLRRARAAVRPVSQGRLLASQHYTQPTRSAREAGVAALRSACAGVPRGDDGVPPAARRAERVRPRGRQRRRAQKSGPRTRFPTCPRTRPRATSEECALEGPLCPWASR